MKRKRTHRNMQTFRELLEEDAAMVTLRRQRFKNRTSNNKNRTVSESPYLASGVVGRSVRGSSSTTKQLKALEEGQKLILMKLDELSKEVDSLKAKVKTG